MIRLLANVRQATVKPLIKASLAPGELIYSDEYGIYNRLDEWGYGHENLNHATGEYARDCDGFCEVHVNTMKGFCSLLRNWLRPHRGISQEKPPVYLEFFEFVHNLGKRGKTLLHFLIELLVKYDPETQQQPMSLIYLKNFSLVWRNI